MSTYKKIKASFRLNVLNNFKTFNEVNIADIPKEKAQFPNSNDYWYEVDLKNNETTSCIYELGPNAYFPPHYHKDNCETIHLLTPESSIEVITEDDYFNISYPNGTSFKKGVTHTIINHNPFPVKLLVVWRPRMEGWNANFKNETIKNPND